MIKRQPLRLICDDCVKAMPETREASVDAIVTDPPYGLRFMDEEFDNLGVGKEQQAWHERWAQKALQVLKPGGYLLAFGGTRTYHRLVCAVEDVGFEIKDSILALYWLHGQGFPKNTDVGRSIDMKLCELPGRHFMRKLLSKSKRKPGDHVCPETSEGDEHRGKGTVLKPAHEPIVVARKPLIGTVAANVLEHGTGGINVAGCRLATEDDLSGGTYGGIFSGTRDDNGNLCKAIGSGNKGRWPPNVVLIHHPDCKPIGTRKSKGRQINRWKDGAKPFGGGAGHPYESEQLPDDEVLVWECVESCPVKELDRQSGILIPCGGTKKTTHSSGMFGIGTPGYSYTDTGGASRFFPCFKYHKKAGKKEKNAGLPEGVLNLHPTVKPVELMQWLVRLVTPPKGLVLDPFMGSGTTGIACVKEGFRFVGIDNNPESVEIARLRIVHAWKERQLRGKKSQQ